MKHRFKKILLCIAGVTAITLGAITATANVNLQTSIFGATSDSVKYELYYRECDMLARTCITHNRGEVYGTLECSRVADMAESVGRMGDIGIFKNVTAMCKPYRAL